MTAQCDPGWEWASNSLNQNPCAIAGALEAPCRGLGLYTLGPLNGTNYVTPQEGSALPCECNTIMYSLFMACTGCQEQQLQSWDFWAQYCDAVYVTQYPLDVPSGTAVPHWAYLNVTVIGMWDPIVARTVIDQPESTGVESPVSTSLFSSNTGSLTPTNTPRSSSGGGGPNVGAIAGGVVGGLAALGMLAALVVWFIIRRRRSRVAPSSAFMKSDEAPEYPKYEPPPVYARPPDPPQTAYRPSGPPTLPTLLYDPSTGGATGYPLTPNDPLVPLRGRYGGAPEV